MRILILYPGLFGERRQLLKPFQWRLRLTGTRLVLADDRIHGEDRQVFSDVLELPGPEDAAGAWQVLARYLDRNPVQGIIAQSEPALLLGARAAREFGLAGPSVESALATVNKHDSRTRFQGANICQPAFELVGDAPGIQRFAAQHGWPVVIKAVATSRQRLVLRVDNPSQCEGAAQRMIHGLQGARDVRRLVSFAELEGVDLGLDPTREFLVEAFQGGQPLECDAMLSGTTSHWFGVCEQIPSPRRGFFIEGYLLPGRLPQTERQLALQTAQAAVQTLGLSNTGVSVEMNRNDRGLHVIEVNGRLPWDDGLHDLIQASTGCVPAAMALRVAMGRKLGKVQTNKHGALIYRCQYEPGYLEQVPEPQHCLEPGSRHVNVHLYAKRGQNLLPGEHPDSQPHLAGVLATDPKSTDRALQKARTVVDKMHFQVLGEEPAGRIPSPS